MLFNCHETAVLDISERRTQLESRFRFRLPPHETVAALQDKAKFQELAIERGLCVPKGRILRQPQDIAGLASFCFPVIAKPADKALVHDGKAPGVARFNSFHEASAGCARLLEAGDILVQEWIEGANDQIYFCLFYRGRKDEMVSMFTGRKLLSSPRDVGLTAWCAAAPDARKTLEFMTRAFCDAVGYSGMGGVEYKWDVINRRFVIIEPTVGRTDMQHEVATLCGVNIPLQAYCHEMELPAPAFVAPRPGAVWRSSLVEFLKARPPALAPGAIVHDGYWRRDDPMPALIHYTLGSAASASRRLRKYAVNLRHFGAQLAQGGMDVAPRGAIGRTHGR